jgi:phage terminase small subunit
MQQLFVDEYVIDEIAIQAALRAGFSPKTAASIAQNLLRKPQVADAIKLRRIEFKKKQDEYFENKIVSKSRLILEQQYIALFNSGELFKKDGTPLTISDMPESVLRAISIEFNRENGVIVSDTIKTPTATQKSSAINLLMEFLDKKEKIALELNKEKESHEGLLPINDDYVQALPLVEDDKEE